MLTVGKTVIYPEFDSGHYKGQYNINNKYLNSFWFNSQESIWGRLAKKFALIVEEEIKKDMKLKMNPEAYKDIFETATINKASPEVKDESTTLR